MKKVALASLLACAVLTLGLSLAFAQTAVQLGTQPAQIQMPEAEATAYNNAVSQSNPQVKAAAIEDYLTKYPNSSVKQNTLVMLMMTYYQLGNGAKVLDAADRILQLDPSNMQALTLETFFRS